MRRDSLINLILFGLLPVAVSILAVLMHFISSLNPVLVKPFLLALCGAALILFAKIKQKNRTRKLISFSFKSMILREKQIYLSGYVIYSIGIGFLLFYLIGSYLPNRNL